MKTSRSFAFALVLLASMFVSSVASADIKDTSERSAKIDKLIADSLGEQKLERNAPLTDEQFVRRIYLAVIGRIPTQNEAAEFIQDTKEKKREQLIDRLLESEGYVSHYYNYWADILRINRRLGRSGASNEYAYKHWVKESLRSNRPYDKMVFELVSATGNVWDNGATGYYQRDRGMPLDNMANTVRVFLGTRLECAQCHDHPFDEWKQTDFFHMASFSFGVRPGYVGDDNRTMMQRSINDKRREFLIRKSEEITGVKGFYLFRRDSDISRLYAKDDRRSIARRKGIKTEKEYRKLNNKVMAALKEYEQRRRVVGQVLNDIYTPLRYSTVGTQDRNAKLPHDYQYNNADPNQEMDPSVMFGEKIDSDLLEDGYLNAYAGWMTSKKNPRFTRVIANRLWKKAFGIGLVEPVDQYTASTLAANPELLEYIEQCMKDFDYDMKSFLAMIYKSDSWQRQACAEEIASGEPFYFPGPAMQRMSAEQIWDSIAALTIPDVDHYQPTLANELQAIDRDRKIRNALESRSPEEFRSMIERLANSVSENYDEMTKLRTKFLKARQDDDVQLAKRLSNELRSVNGSMRREIYQVAYKGADGRTKNMASLMQAAGMSEMSDDGDASSGERYVVSSLPRVKIEQPEGLSPRERANWVKRQRYYASSWNNVTRTMMRSSELPTPAPRGHFLREFGQSDRELIENANNAASVPQALSLMNSNLADTLRHPYSVLGQTLADCDSPREEIEALYQLMLTRKPSEREISRLQQEYETDPQNAQHNVVWALLNTQQFIFVR